MLLCCGVGSNPDSAERGVVALVRGLGGRQNRVSLALVPSEGRYTYLFQTAGACSVTRRAQDLISSQGLKSHVISPAALHATRYDHLHVTQPRPHPMLNCWHP
jgi:hypothetical protein